MTSPAGHRARLLYTAALFAMAVCSQSCVAGAGSQWAAVGGDLANTRFSTLSQIRTSNVARLGGAWLREFDSPTRATPVICGGLLLISDGTTLHALNPRSGVSVWEYRPTGAAPARGGPAVGDGKVFVGLTDTRVVALRLATGELLWTAYAASAPPAASQFGNNLQFGPGMPVFNPKIGFISNAVTYVNGVVTTGVSGGDGGTRGKIAALDAATGKRLWDFYVIPSPGGPGSSTWPSDGSALERGGGAVWSVGAADPELGMVYYGTGNAVPINWGGDRAGDNLYTASIVALDVKSGALKWHFQLTHHDIFDMDVSTPIVLYEARSKNAIRRALAAMRADGYLFTFDRETGEPLFPIEERAVRQDPRQRTAATQPFPAGARELGPACADPATMASGFVPGCFFDPQSFDRPNVAIPLTTVRQAPMSYDPETGYFYAMAGIQSAWLRNFPNPYTVSVSHPPGSKEHGLFAAIDGRSGQIVWQQHSAWGLASGSGALTTAGGLLFHVEGDGNVVASDARTGVELWRFQTGFLGTAGIVSNTSEAPLATYEENGEQYVAVPLGKSLWALKLNGKLPPRDAPRPPPNEFGFAGMVSRVDSGGEIAIGAVISDLIDARSEHTFDEYAFSPGRSRIKVNQPLRWTNYGSVPHTIVSADGSWTTGLIEPSQSALVTIHEPGTYVYFAREFPFAKGELIVQ